MPRHGVPATAGLRFPGGRRGEVPPLEIDGHQEAAQEAEAEETVHAPAGRELVDRCLHAIGHGPADADLRNRDHGHGQLPARRGDRDPPARAEPDSGRLEHRGREHAEGRPRGQ